MTALPGYLLELLRQRGTYVTAPAVGALAAVVGAAVGTVAAWKLASEPFDSRVLAGAGAIGAAVAFSIWRYICRVPNNLSGHIGVAFAIAAETDNERKRIRNDFISQVRDILGRTSEPAPFNVIEIPSYLAPDVNDTVGALTFLQKSRSHLLIWGRITTRKLRGKDVYLLRLEGVVTHLPVEVGKSHALSQEMRQAIPRQTIVSIENELKQFESVSTSFASATMYIVALTSALCGAFAFSKHLLAELDKILSSGTKAVKRAKVKRNPADAEVVGRLKRLLPSRQADVCRAQFFVAFDEWQRDKANLALLHEAEGYLEECRGHLRRIAADGPDYWVPKALLEVTLRTDLVAAEKLLNRCRASAINDPVWRLSLAFVKALQGDMDSAVSCYEVAVDREVHRSTVLQVEDYVQYWLEHRTEVPGLYLLSALLNAYLKNDRALATQDLDKFRAKAPTPSPRVQDCITKLEHSLAPIT